MAYGFNSVLRRRYLPAWITLVVGLAASGGLGWRLHRQAVELDRLRLERMAEVVRERLQTKLQTTDLIMRHAQDYFGSQEIITAGMFREWCRKYGWSITAPWMHGLAMYTNRNAGHWRDRLPADLTTWKAAEFRSFARLASDATVSLEFAFGYSHDPTKRWPTNYAKRVTWGERLQGFAGAIPVNSPQTTGRQVVIEHAGGEARYGATVGVPIYEPGRDELRDLIVGARPKVDGHLYNWNLCRGVLLVPVDYVLLESLIWGDEPREVGVEIYAAAQPGPDAWLNRAASSVRALDQSFKPYLTVSVPWKLYNAHWSLFVYTLPAFEAGSPRYMARLTFFAGAAVTLLATALVGVGLRAQNRQRLLTEQIRDARDALVAAEQQRQRLSHDLHDNTVQTLYAIQLGLGHTSQKLDSEPAHARRELSTVRAELDGVIAGIRRFITAEERTEIAADLSVVLHTLVARAQVGTKAKLELHCDAAAANRLTGSQAVQLANIAREALSNSLRHGKPQRVQITLQLDSGVVYLEIFDDGAGFDPKVPGRQGVGLASMTSRTTELGGNLNLQSAPGQGSRVVVRVPASPPPRGEPEPAGKDQALP